MFMSLCACVFDSCVCFLFVRTFVRISICARVFQFVRVYFKLCACISICARVFQFARVFALLGHRTLSLDGI